MIPELDTDLDRKLPNEWTVVERPLLQQLVAVKPINADEKLDDPPESGIERIS